jgi:hypothetical protein
VSKPIPTGYSVVLNAALGMVAAAQPLDVRHPQLIELLALWNVACDGRRMPQPSDLSHGQCRKFADHLLVVEPQDDGRDFIYTRVGKGIVALAGQDYTGLTTRVLPPAARSCVLPEYQTAYRTRAPAAIEHIDVLATGRRELLAKLILPLSEDGRTVSRLIAGLYPVE